MTNTEKAWLAGIIDGEGCIYARVEKTGYLKTNLQIVMTHKPTMEYICKITESDGPKNVTPAPTNRKIAWRWNCQAQRGAKLLTEVLPYLVTKKSQAEIFIKLMAMRAIKQNNDIPKQLQLAQELKDEKLVGTELLC